MRQGSTISWPKAASGISASPAPMYLDTQWHAPSGLFAVITVGGDQAGAQGVLCRLVAMAKLQFGEDVAHVALDGVDADRQRLGDLLVGRALRRAG